MRKFIGLWFTIALMLWAVWSCDSQLEEEPFAPPTDSIKLSQLVGKWQLVAASLIKPIQVENLFKDSLLKDFRCLQNSQFTFEANERFMEYSDCYANKTENGSFFLSSGGTQIVLDYDRESLTNRIFSVKSYSTENYLTVDYSDSIFIFGNKIGFTASLTFLKFN